MTPNSLKNLVKCAVRTRSAVGISASLYNPQQQHTNVRTLWDRSELASSSTCDLKFRFSNDSVVNNAHQRWFSDAPQTADKTSCNTSACWNCASARCFDNGKFFCSSCKLIQPPFQNMTHFELKNTTQNALQHFDVPFGYDVELTSIQETYHRLQNLLHPDKFGQNTKVEQEYAAAQSSLLNRAYRTLSHPVDRAVYMLTLSGCPIVEQDMSLVDPEFLCEMLELNEFVAETSDLDEVRKVGAEASVALQSCEREFATAYEAGQLDAAKHVLARMNYHARVKSNVDKRLGFY